MVVSQRLIEFIHKKYKHDKGMAHSILGKLFNIPECCIAQFCTEMEKNGPGYALRQAESLNMNLSDFCTTTDALFIGHVPCDTCLRELHI